MTREYCFNILHLPYSASDSEIKKAYRSLTLQYHPDKNKDISAQSKFIEITKAYNYLVSSKYDNDWMLESLKKQYAKQDTADKIYKDKMREILKKQREEESQQSNERAEEISLLFILSIFLIIVGIYTVWHLFF
jgi:curved DNA-binding protein CbpA